jgi:hypothetical protein
MSRILRRPMFRGGPVSSYGTGIAAPLVPGYQGGGQIGGGIIYGKPMADGRYGFADPLWIAEAKKNWPGMTLGSETLNNEWMIKGQPIYGADSPHGMQPKIGRSGLDVDYLFKPEGSGEGEFQTLNLGDIYSEDLAADIEEKERAEAAGVDVETLKAIDKENEGLAGEGEIETSKVWVSDMVDGVPQKTGKWVEKPTKKKSLGDSEIDKLRAEIAQLRKDGMGSEGIAINKETYLEALGGAKARGEDISEMLLGFAGAEGDDTMSKLKSFFKSESQRKGRYRSLEDTAGLLAIKDHIAGKRSKESLAQLLGQLDYKAKLDKKSLGENIMKAAGPGSTPTLSNIKVGVKSTYPGVGIEEVTSTEGLEFEDSDEGKIFIETDTKTVYTIKDGVKKVLY